MHCSEETGDRPSVISCDCDIQRDERADERGIRSVVLRSDGGPLEQTLTVVSADTLAPGITEINFESNRPICALPGQFAHFEVKGALLRRPISIAGADNASGTLRFIIQSVGKGSSLLSSLRAGDRVSALLPLGTPFPIDVLLERVSSGCVWLVSGGIGVAPMLFCADMIKKSGYAANSFVGFRDSEHMFGVSELKECGAVVVSCGGFITDELERALRSERPDLILSCGPTPMLKSLQAVCSKHGIRAYASLEEHMGCGIGACLVCSCKINNGVDFSYKRVCRDGPVFELSEVVFE